MRVSQRAGRETQLALLRRSTSDPFDHPSCLGPCNEESQPPMARPRLSCNPIARYFEWKRRGLSRRTLSFTNRFLREEQGHKFLCLSRSPALERDGAVPSIRLFILSQSPAGRSAQNPVEHFGRHRHLTCPVRHFTFRLPERARQRQRQRERSSGGNAFWRVAGQTRGPAGGASKFRLSPRFSWGRCRSRACGITGGTARAWRGQRFSALLRPPSAKTDNRSKHHSGGRCLI